jgi:hypothetical protein
MRQRLTFASCGTTFGVLRLVAALVYTIQSGDQTPHSKDRTTQESAAFS